jgi:archaellum component FlaC
VLPFNFLQRLQEEVERLRNKLESVVSSVETVIQDAQSAQVRGRKGGPTYLLT